MPIAAMVLTLSCARAPQGNVSPAGKLSAPTTSVAFTPVIVFDNSPEWGLPHEAKRQLLDKNETPPLKALNFQELTAGKIDTVRIRYYNTNSWATEAQAREYVIKFFADKKMRTFRFQEWSQAVGVPEIECLVDFTEDYQMKLITEGKRAYHEGRLLIWQTESCFRDATGRWWYMDASNNFHQFHPKGIRNLAN